MRIIKPGKVPVKTFKCDVCGCLFEASRKEFAIWNPMCGGAASCRCPECGEICSETSPGIVAITSDGVEGYNP